MEKLIEKYKSEIRRIAGESYAYPIRVIPGSTEKPKLVGKRFWKTQFRAHGGRFVKTLYTPSTRQIVVGEQWLENRDTVYDRDFPVLAD